MEIISPSSSSSIAFTVGVGKQITLAATGLHGTDEVFIDILELPAAPDFSGNYCCNLGKVDIKVTRRTPLRCPDGRPVRLTADFPAGAISAPQGVALGARVEAAPESFVTVFAHESTSSGCGGCICDYDYCASVRLPGGDNGTVGYGFNAADPKDPQATVEIPPGASYGNLDSIWIYPAAGPGHTIRVEDCDCNFVGYAVNRSNCAPGCGCLDAEGALAANPLSFC